jgi:site-specific recombinase XerD
LARQKAEHDDELALEDALADAWVPKTDAAARAVPYGFDPRTSIIVERFFEQYDEWPVSHNGVGRRLKRAADATDAIDAEAIYPHCLRATAATFHAGRGLRAINLQALFGWADLSTARKYVRISGEAVSNALQNVHA